jgi:hypothetical protein
MLKPKSNLYPAIFANRLNFIVEVEKFTRKLCETPKEATCVIDWLKKQSQGCSNYATK